MMTSLSRRSFLGAVSASAAERAGRQATAVAQVKPVLGTPTLMIGGKPSGPMIYTRCAGTLEQLGQIADRNFSVHFEMVGNVGWPGMQNETFRGLDTHMEQFLRQVPNARIVLR